MNPTYMLKRIIDFSSLALVLFLSTGVFAQPYAWAGTSNDISILCNNVIAKDQFLLTSVDLANTFELDSEVMNQLVEFQSRLSKQNVKLLLLILPPRGLTTDLTTSNYNYVEASISFNALIKEIQKAGIDTLNLIDSVSNESRENFYRIGDPHWSTTGLQIATEKVVDYISSESILLDTIPFESSFTDVNLMPYYLSLVKDGCPDIAEGYLSENNFGDGIETIIQRHSIEVDEESQDSLSDSLFGGSDSSSIVLIGTSQSSSPYNFASWLSSELSTLVYDYSVGGGSAYSGMELFLNDYSQGELARPELIIWEMPVSEMMKVTTNNQGPAFNNPQSMHQIVPWLGECSNVIETFKGTGIESIADQKQPLINFIQEIKPKGVEVTENIEESSTVMTFTGEIDPWLSYIVPKSALVKNSQLELEVNVFSEDSMHMQLFVHTSDYSSVLAQGEMLFFDTPQKNAKVKFTVPEELNDNLIVFRIDGPDVPIAGMKMEVQDVFINGLSPLKEEGLFSQLQEHNIYGDKYFLELETFSASDNKFEVEFNYGNGVRNSIAVARSSRIANNKLFRVALSPYIVRPLESVGIVFDKDSNSLGVKQARICLEASE